MVFYTLRNLLSATFSFMPRRTIRRYKRRSNKNAARRAPVNAVHSALHAPPSSISFIQPRTRVERYRVSTTDTINTTAGGNIFFSVPMDPTTTSGEWIDIAALYEEFRIIGGLITIVPSQPLTTAGSSRAQGLAVIAYDHALFYTPAGYVDLTAYATRDIFNTQSVMLKPYEYGFTVPMVGVDNPIPWYSTTSTFTPNSCIVMVATGLTPNDQYFQFVLDYYIEVRTRS